jgi:rhodanese-related sulfurtransferase
MNPADRTPADRTLLIEPLLMNGGAVPGSVARSGWWSPDQVREALVSGEELAVLDVRSEAAFADGHPLFAASIPLDHLESRVLWGVPRPATPMVLYGTDEAEEEAAVDRLARLGFTGVARLEGGLSGLGGQRGRAVR